MIFYFYLKLICRGLELQFFWKSIPFNTSNSPPSDNLNDQKLRQELKDRIKKLEGRDKKEKKEKKYNAIDHAKEGERSIHDLAHSIA